MSDALSSARLAAYGVFALPLAFAGLPIYVHLPHYYAHQFGMNLMTLGAVLLAVRLIDAVLDPLIGLWSDRLQRYRKRIIALTAPILALGYMGLFVVPQAAQGWIGGWLFMMLIVVYTCFSVLMINYYALGTELGRRPAEQIRVSAYREACMLLGIVSAAILPHALSNSFGIAAGYRYFVAIFVLLLFAAGAVTIIGTRAKAAGKKQRRGFSDLFEFFSLQSFRWLFAIFMCNAIAGAITATLFLFFVEDIIGAAEQSGRMLMLYFLAGALAIPLWLVCVRRIGKGQTWLFSMVSSILIFIWAFTLSHGDVQAFYVICLLSGIMLGADFIIPPALLSDTLNTTGKGAGMGFGLWNFIGKLNLSLAAGIALPLLGAIGYAPGGENTPETLGYISFAYALLPCLFKAVAALMLFLSPLDRRSA